MALSAMSVPARLQREGYTLIPFRSLRMHLAKSEPHQLGFARVAALLAGAATAPRLNPPREYTFHQ